MTLQEFKTKYKLEKVQLFTVEGHVYTEPIEVKLNINKNITRADFKNLSKLSVVPYLDGYVMTKDETIRPYGVKLEGRWTEGYALDLHTIESTFSAAVKGRVYWDTIRSPIAKELYRLKYRKELSRVDPIAKAVADFLKQFEDKWCLDVIIPVPPSNVARDFQPVFEMANAISLLVDIPLDCESLRKLTSTPQIKEINDFQGRREVLESAFSMSFNVLKEKNVLIFDDLYRSGETLNAVSEVVMNSGMAKNVYVLTITKTRSKR